MNRLTTNQMQKWLVASNNHGVTGGGPSTPTQAELLNQASGIVSGIFPSQISATEVSISAGRAIFLNDSDPSNPIVSVVDYPGGVETIDLNQQGLTWLFLKPDGTIQQLFNDPQPSDFEDMISVGHVLINNSNMLAALPYRDLLPRKYDFFRQFLLGVRVMQVGLRPLFSASMELGLSSGLFIKPGFAFDAVQRDPNVQRVDEQPTTQLLALTSTTFLGPIAGVPDATEYDVGGTVTPSPGASGSAVNYLILFSGAVLVQYGATVYPTLRAATIAAYDEEWTILPMLKFQAVLLGVLSVTRGATKLQYQACWQSADAFGQLNSALSNLDKI